MKPQAFMESTTIDNVIIPGGLNRIRFHFDRGGSNVSYFRFVNPVPVNLSIYDLFGNRMISSNIGSALSFSRRIDDLASKPGIYILSLTTGTGSLTRKVIIN